MAFLVVDEGIITLLFPPEITCYFLLGQWQQTRVVNDVKFLMQIKGILKGQKLQKKKKKNVLFDLKSNIWGCYKMTE